MLAAVCAAALAGGLAAAPAEAKRRPQGPTLDRPAPASLVLQSRVAFAWKPVPGALGYDLRLARDRGFTRSVLTQHARGPRLTTLLHRGAWYWRVRTRRAMWSRWSNARLVRVRPARDVFAPSRPGALRVEAIAATSVSLGWLAARDDLRVSGYRLEATCGPAVVRTDVARGTSATLDGLACGTVYSFAARALDAAGNVSPASPVAHARTRSCTGTGTSSGARPSTAAPAAPDLLPPTTPTGLAAAAVTDTAVALTWPASTDPDGTVAGYAVYRNGALLGQPRAPGFVARNLAASTPYAFSVHALDRAGHVSADAVLAVTTAAPIPATGSVYAFLLASTDASFQDLQAHYRQIGTVAPTYFHVERNGSISGVDDPLVTGWSRLHGVRVEPRVETQDASSLHGILPDPVAREALVQRIAELAAANGYDGINLDFEAGLVADRDAFTGFITSLAAALHAQGATLTVDVSPKNNPLGSPRAQFYDYPALAAVADHLFVMAWDLHWATSPAGPITDVTWVSRILAYMDTVPHRERFILGTQLYGFDWPTGARATPLEFDAITALAAQVGATPQWNAVAQEPYFTYTDGAGVPHTVYYATAQSVDARLALARAHGYGVGVWRLGREDQSTWAVPSLNA